MMTYMGSTEREMATLANSITIIRLKDRKVKRSPKRVLFEDFKQKRVEIADTVFISMRSRKIHTWRISQMVEGRYVE